MIGLVMSQTGRDFGQPVGAEGKSQEQNEQQRNNGKPAV
jgi:hypothetical protein